MLLIMLQDISEGQAGLVAEVGVSQQLLQQRLPDGLLRVKPQLLRGGVPGHHLAVDVPAGLPEDGETLLRWLAVERDASQARGKVPAIPEVIDGVVFQRRQGSSVQGAHLLLHHVSPLVRRQAEQILKHTDETLSRPQSLSCG